MAESTISIPWDVTKPEGSKFYIKYDPAKTSQQVSFTSDENRAAARSRTITFVTVAPGLSTESQKRIEVTVNQAAGVVTYSYSLTVSKTTAAAAGETLTLTPEVQKIINGTNEGSPYTVDGVTYKVEIGTVSGNSWTIPENQSTDKLTDLTVIATFPASVGGGTASATIEQEAGVKTYSTPSVSLSYDDIPAEGGTVEPRVTVSQTWGWNGKTAGGGTVDNLGEWDFESMTGSVDKSSGIVTAASKGTEISDRTEVATGILLNVTLNEKTGTSAAVTVYQEANAITSTAYGTPVINFQLSQTSIPALGTNGIDPIIPSYSAYEPITYTYTSGSSNTVQSTLDRNHVGIESNQDWAYFGEYEDPDYFGIQLVVDENTGSQRSAIITVEARGTSHTSTKSITITQSAATITYNVRLTGSTTTAAATGATITIYPQIQEVINGKAGSWVNTGGVTLSTTLGSIINTTQLSVPENQSTSSRTITVTGNFSNEGKTATLVITQSAGVKTYSTPVVTLSYDDIPAGGGTVFPKLSYSQTWGWNGKTTGGGTITTGGTVAYTNASDNTKGTVTASSKGTTVSERSSVKTGVTASVTLNGKTGTSTAVTVYQAANAITSTTKGTPVISLSTSATTIAATGGTITVTSSVSIPTTNHYTSGSTAAGTPKSATPTVTVSGTGFSYANGQVTVAENTTTSTRTGTVRATYTGATAKTVTITQSAGQAIILSVDETTLGWENTVFTLYSEIHLGSYTTEDVFEKRNGYSYKFITSGPIYHNEDYGYSGNKHADEFAFDDYNYSLTNDEQFSVTLEVYQYGGSPVASSTIHLTRKHSPGFLVLKTSQNKIISWESGINNDYSNITGETFHFVTSSDDFVAGTFVLSSSDALSSDEYLLDHVNTYQYSGYLAALPGATLNDPAFMVTGHDSDGAVISYNGRFFDSEHIQITLNFSF